MTATQTSLQIMKFLCATQKDYEQYFAKHVINRDLLIESNIVGFGNKIGKITNDITSQFDIISYYDRNSVEWQELDYRIKCGQMAQQNDIDKLFVSSYRKV